MKTCELKVLIRKEKKVCTRGEYGDFTYSIVPLIKLGIKRASIESLLENLNAMGDRKRRRGEQIEQKLSNDGSEQRLRAGYRLDEKLRIQKLRSEFLSFTRFHVSTYPCTDSIAFPNSKKW